jgi:cold shock CspA family protein
MMPNNDENRIVGRIIKVSDAGWGFISSRDIKFTRIFFHWTALRQDTLSFTELKTGMRAEFTPVEIPGKGFRAIHIKIVEQQDANETEMPALSE